MRIPASLLVVGTAALVAALALRTDAFVLVGLALIGAGIWAADR